MTEGHELTGHLAPFRSASQQAQDALDARVKARGERSMQFHEVQDWREGVNLLRLTCYAELLKRCAEQARHRAWADSFFRRDSGRAPEPPEVDDSGPDELPEEE